MDSQKYKRLLQITALLKKPLFMASQSDFSRIGIVKGVESYVSIQCRHALALDLPTGLERRVDELISIFRGFDAIPDMEKREKIGRAVEILKYLDTSIRDISLSEVRSCLLQLKKPLEDIKGVGERISLSFHHKGITSVEDILYFFPIRYEDRRSSIAISELRKGEKCVATGSILSSGEVFYGRRKVFEMLVSDNTGTMKIKWFNYKSPHMRRKFRPGQTIIAFGLVNVLSGNKEMVHPEIELIEREDIGKWKCVIPVYSQVGRLGQGTVRKVVRDIVAEYARYALGTLPGYIRGRHHILTLSDALLKLHCIGESVEMPDSNDLARKSVIFDEFFSLEAGLSLIKRDAHSKRGISFRKDSPLLDRFLQDLPFPLTGAQKRVIDEISSDMELPRPMSRLLQGDVGSGKTIVALSAALIAIQNGYQVALMSPTEILSEQHFLTIRRYANVFPVKTVLLTGSVPAREKKDLYASVQNGEVNMVIGTHAIIQDHLLFQRLGLAIIDEQHRFGVMQRDMIRSKGGYNFTPDMLVMTATPIPRTLSMTIFGDLDLSVIDEMPPCRKPAITRLFRENDRDHVYQIVIRELNLGKQAYIVCPLVSESEELDLMDATSTKQELEAGALKSFRLALLHGRMGSREKESIMKCFKKGEIDVLVATTVIEVGIDVPNANVIVVEHAERFGISQLHQLRGRVGRGTRQSYCLLLSRNRVSDTAYRRLRAVQDISDGFVLSEEDLKLRGHGDIFGTRQSGLPDFRTADPVHDLDLLMAARKEAFDLVEVDPDLSDKRHAGLKEIISSRWSGRLHIATVG